MITIEKEIQLTITYPLDKLGTIEDILFFDIETTGFSREYAQLYLIGCIYCKDNKWHLIQWFSSTKDSEPELLDAFFNLLKSYQILVHFNGDTFDIPYLLSRCIYHKRNYTFEKIKSIDIYKKIKNYKKLLKLENVKQKTIEQFLNFNRSDLYSGGQLIEVYKEYLVTHDPYLYGLLLLHNEEDLKGMLSILPILYYTDFLQENFILIKEKLCTDIHTPNGIITELYLTCQSNIFLPTSFSSFVDTWYLSASANILKLRILLYKGTCKYFYPDYKNYYYLTMEDVAIHKSVAEFVEKEYKTKATAKTCYTKKNSCFIPQKQKIFIPSYQLEYKDKLMYGEYQKDLFENPEILNNYIKHIVHFIK